MDKYILNNELNNSDENVFKTTKNLHRNDAGL